MDHSSQDRKRVALITGASRGIGRAVALELASLGYHIAVNYRSAEAEAKEVKDTILSQKGKAEIYQADVSDPEQAENLCSSVEKDFGVIDVLVNNAGITRDTLLMRMKNHMWDEVLKTNLNSLFYCTRHVARSMMKQRWGRIVNMSSVVGVIGNAGQANYAAAKAGVLGFTKSIAREYASRGITVNAVAPGFILTDMTGGLDEETRKEYLKNIPLASFGTAEDVAKTVAFLVSEGARYITGQVLHVDGGMVM